MSPGPLSGRPKPRQIIKPYVNSSFLKILKKLGGQSQLRKFRFALIKYTKVNNISTNILIWLKLSVVSV